MHSIEQLRKVLYLKDGTLYWAIHNKKCLPGTKAGNINKAGYIDLRYDGERYYAHRIIFAFTHNRWPTGKIDHIDGNVANNYPHNLREVDNSQNSANTKIRHNNKTGIKGLYKQDNGWSAEISMYKVRHRKYFSNKSDAIKWLKITRIAVHGNYARKP